MSSKNNLQQIIYEKSLKETTKYMYKTVVISGGEGYEEYKVSNTPSTTSSSITNANTFNVNNSTQVNNNNDINQNETIINSLNNQACLINYSNKNSTTSNLADSYLGKDDVVNYVLTWEI